MHEIAIQQLDHAALALIQALAKYYDELKPYFEGDQLESLHQDVVNLRRSLLGLQMGPLYWEIPAEIFIDLDAPGEPPRRQAQIFIDVNYYQKRVDRSLVADLFPTARGAREPLSAVERAQDLGLLAERALGVCRLREPVWTGESEQDAKGSERRARTGSRGHFSPELGARPVQVRRARTQNRIGVLNDREEPRRHPDLT